MTESQPDDTTVAAGTMDSIAALFEAKESSLLLYARRLVDSEETAQDIVQEAFMKLHANYDAVRQPVPWLYRTVHNLAINQVRARRKIVPLATTQNQDDEAELPDPQPLPDEQIERMETIGQMRLCLAALDDRQRELVHLKFHDGLSYKEISERTRLSISNVGYLLHHALKDLTAALKKAGVS
jgi:RNA polymerase sigma-70 factor (ECF subfamily)